MVDERTIAVYDAKAGEYAEVFTDRSPDQSLADFIALIPMGGNVLDLGCGPGRASVHMRDAGLIPDPLDASASMVALAQDQGLPARQATFDDITGTAIYDGVWANFSLLHAPRDALPKHLSAIATALKPRGILHIGMKSGQGAARDGIERLYTYVETDELAALLETAGLSVIYTREGAEVGMAGTKDPFIIMRAKKDG